MIRKKEVRKQEGKKITFCQLRLLKTGRASGKHEGSEALQKPKKGGMEGIQERKILSRKTCDLEEEGHKDFLCNGLKSCFKHLCQNSRDEVRGRGVGLEILLHYQIDFENHVHSKRTLGSTRN